MGLIRLAVALLAAPLVSQQMSAPTFVGLAHWQQGSGVIFPQPGHVRCEAWADAADTLPSTGPWGSVGWTAVSRGGKLHWLSESTVYSLPPAYYRVSPMGQGLTCWLVGPRATAPVQLPWCVAGFDMLAIDPTHLSLWTPSLENAVPPASASPPTLVPMVTAWGPVDRSWLSWAIPMDLELSGSVWVTHAMVMDAGLWLSGESVVQIL